MSTIDDMTSTPPLAPALNGLGRSARAAIDRVASAGFTAIAFGVDHPELHPRSLDASSRRGLIAVLRQRGLRLASVDAFLPPALFRDPAHVDQVVLALIEAVDLAADLSPATGGAWSLGLSVHFPKLALSDGDTDERTDLVSDVPGVAAVIERAAHRGVPVIDFRADGSWADRDLVMRGVDCRAVLQHGGDPVTAVHQAGDRLLGLRLADQNSDGSARPLEGGARCFDLLALKVALSVNGYQRPVAVSTQGWKDPWVGLGQTQQAWA